MVFKSALGDTSNLEKYPLAFTFSIENYYNPIGLANLEFIGFRG